MHSYDPFCLPDVDLGPAQDQPDDPCQRFEKCNADEVEIDIIDEHRAAITTKYTLIDFLENFISQCISDNSYISVEKYDN